MSTESGPAWLAGFKADYNDILVKEWSPYLGAVILVIIMAVLMGSGMP